MFARTHNEGAQTESNYEMRSNQEEEARNEGQEGNDEGDGQEINEETLMIKISGLMHQLVVAKERLYLYEDLSAKLRRQNVELMEKVKDLERALESKSSLVQQKIQIISQLNNDSTQKDKQIKQLEVKIEALKTVQPNPKARKKEKELKKINELLQKQLQSANTKIIELERSIHQKTSLVYHEAISRLRESNFNTRTAFHPLNPMKNTIMGNFGHELGYSKTRGFENKGHYL